MIPPITHNRVLSAFASDIPSSQILLDPNFESFTFVEKLKSIGLIDGHYNVQFIPKEIPEISKKGKARFDHLMKRAVHCYSHDGEIIVSKNHAEYISGFKSVLSEKGIEIQSYLRGGYAAYVADLGEYFEFLIHEFLTSKNLPIDLLDKEIEAFKNLKEVAPHDVDLFDQVLTNGIPSTALCNYHIEFLGQKKKIKFLQLLLPGEVTPLFPYPADYVLFTLGNEKFQTDRIIGRLHHEYLHARDDIRIEIKNNQMCVPESAGNFWQMVIDRKLKIVRTEKWHEKDFRAGLAALQLIQDDHILIEDKCSLQSILHYALNTGSEKVFTGAIDRAKLHCKDSGEFLLSVLIAYSHIATIPEEHLKILMDKIGEIPPLPSLYKYALLLTLYKDKTSNAEWDPSGFLILYWNNHRIVFPKNFSITSTEKPFFSSQIGSWSKASSCVMNPVYKILDGELSYLERVLFELSLQKAAAPLSEPLKEALVDYLINHDSIQERTSLLQLLPFTFSSSPENLEWMKFFLKCSLKHGLKLWNAFKTKLDEKNRWADFEKIILHIVDERPIQSYILLDEEAIPLESRLRILKKMVGSPFLNLSTSVRIVDELIEAKALINVEPFLIRLLEMLPLKEGYELWKKLESYGPLSQNLLLAIDRLISSKGDLLPEDEEWFFNSNPSKERIEALSDNTGLLLKWINLRQDSLTFQKHKNAFKEQPETYIRCIKQFKLELFAKEWIESFPPPSRHNQTLLFFSDYNPSYFPLLETICSLPGLNEKKVLEALYLRGHPVFENRPVSKLLSYLNDDFSEATKVEIIKYLVQVPFSDKELPALQRWMKTNPPLSIQLISYFLEKENTVVLPVILNHLISMKKSNNDIIWSKALKLSFANPTTLKELIPFFQDSRLVKSIYGKESDLKTKDWGDLVLSQEKLKKVEIEAVLAILSRTKLIYTPENRLRIFLESIYNKNQPADVIESLLLSIQNEDDQRFYSLDLLLKVFNLSMASPSSIDTGFIIIEKILASIPYLNHEKNPFDPIFHLLQTLPLVDFGTSELYNQWNEKRNALLQEWCSIETHTPIKKNNVLEILPYAVVKDSVEYSHLFKLICEQYIEEKVTKEEFQNEVREISLSAAPKFQFQNLKEYEDPSLICIQDLLFLLKNKNKRIRAYEAFNFLLKNQKKSFYITEQQIYLDIRRKTEDVIISKINLLEKNKIVHCKYLYSVVEYFQFLIESPLPINLYTEDPILDALELDSILPIDKMSLKRGWLTFVKEFNDGFSLHQKMKIECFIAFEKTQLIEKDVVSYLKKRTLSLKTLLKSLKEETIRDEIELISQIIFAYLSQAKAEELKRFIEKALGGNLGTHNYSEK